MKRLRISLLCHKIEKFAKIEKYAPKKLYGLPAFMVWLRFITKRTVTLDINMTEKPEYKLIYLHFNQGMSINTMSWLGSHFRLSFGCIKYYLVVLRDVWLPLPGDPLAAQAIESATALQLDFAVATVTNAIYEQCREQVERDNQLHMREQEIIEDHKRVVRQLTEYVMWEKKEIEAGIYALVSDQTRETFAYLAAALERFNRDEFGAAIIDIRRFLQALDRMQSSAYELDLIAHQQTAAYLLSFALDSMGNLQEADEERLALVERLRLNSGRRWHLMCRDVMRRLGATAELFLKYHQVTGRSVLDGPPTLHLKPAIDAGKM